MNDSLTACSTCEPTEMASGSAGAAARARAKRHISGQMIPPVWRLLLASSARAVGPPEPVFVWDRDACPPVGGRRGAFETGGRCSNDVQFGCDPDVADAPMKAFRRRDGSVVLQAPGDLGARSFTGPSLDAVKHRCAVVLNSTSSFNMGLYACREWQQSPYTFPNGSTYALTHMEYHDQSTQRMLWSAVTLFKSLDGGGTWQHALPPPRHVVAAAPYRYEAAGPRSSPFGFRSPSNIVSDGRGSYFATVESGWGQGPNAVGQRDGACLMRTRDLTDPASWRAWGGASFNISLAVNPYRDRPFDPRRHLCVPITNMTYISFVYSRTLEQHILFGTTGGNDHMGWSFQVLPTLEHPSPGPQIAVDPAGWIDPAGNASRHTPPTPAPGLWARAINGSARGTQVWWLDPQNATKHRVGSCTVCGGVPACANLRDVPIDKLHAIAEGPPFACSMIGGGGEGAADYLYPSLLDPESNDNFGTVGATPYLYLITNQCVSWHNTSGRASCSPWTSDGIVKRNAVRVPLAFHVR